MEKSIKLIISLVIGALVLASSYFLIENVYISEIKDREASVYSNERNIENKTNAIVTEKGFGTSATTGNGEETTTTDEDNTEPIITTSE